MRISDNRLKLLSRVPEPPPKKKKAAKPGKVAANQNQIRVSDTKDSKRQPCHLQAAVAR